MRISEEVCWLQLEQDLSVNNSDDGSTADLCSQKTILMIQLHVAESNCMPLFWHIQFYCAVVGSLVKSNSLNTLLTPLLPQWTEYQPEKQLEEKLNFWEMCLLLMRTLMPLMSEWSWRLTQIKDTESDRPCSKATKSASTTGYILGVWENSAFFHFL